MSSDRPPEPPSGVKSRPPRSNNASGATLFDKLKVTKPAQQPPNAVKKSDFTHSIADTMRKERDASTSASNMPPQRKSFSSPSCQRPEINQNQLNFPVKKISWPYEPPAKRRKLNPENGSTDSTDAADVDPISYLRVKPRESSSVAAASSVPDFNGIYVIPLSSIPEFTAYNFGKKLGGEKARELYQYHDWLLCGVISATTPLYRAVKSIVYILNPQFQMSKERNGFIVKIAHQDQIYIAGDAVDFGTCQEIVDQIKRKVCNNVVNIARSDRCGYHLDRLITSFGSARMELNAPGSIAPSLKEKSELKHTDTCPDSSRFLVSSISQLSDQCLDQLSLAVEKQGRGALREVASDAKKRDPTKNALSDASSSVVETFKSGKALGVQSTKSAGGRQVRRLVLENQGEYDDMTSPEERLKLLKRDNASALSGATLHPFSVHMYKDALTKPTDSSAVKRQRHDTSPPEEGSTGDSGRNVEYEEDANDVSLLIGSDDDDDASFPPRPTHAPPVDFFCQECDSTTSIPCRNVGHHLVVVSRK